MYYKTCLLLIFLIVSSIYAQEADSLEGFHKKIDQLILSEEFEKAEQIALDVYKNNPDRTEVICALACVYRNLAMKTQVRINLDALGIKEGENGSAGMDSVSFKKNIKEEIVFDTVIYKKAEELYESIIKKDPLYQNAYYNLLNDYAKMHNFDKYFRVLDKFISNLNDDELKKNSLIELAYKLVENEGAGFQVAVRMYERILKAYPDYSYAKADLATIYNMHGETLKAIPIFKEAYEQNPNDKLTLTNYLYALVFDEDFDQAFELAVKLSEMDSEKYYLAGMLAYFLGKPYKEYFDKLEEFRVKEVQEPKKDFWYTASMEFKNIEEKDEETKLEFLQYLLDNFNYAGLTADAIAAGNLAMKIEQTNFTLLTLGSIYDANENLKMTLKYLDLISKRRENDSTVISKYNLLSNYARIYMVKDKFEEAREYLIKMIGQKNPDARLNHYLGLCCLGLGKKEEAVEYFKKNSLLNEKDQMEWINESIRKLRVLGIKN